MNSAYGAYFLQMLGTLAVVSILAIVLISFSKKLGMGRPRGPVSLVAVLPLEARRNIYLVQAGQRVWMVGSSEGGLVTLGELHSDELASTSTEAASRTFRDIWSSLRGQGLSTRTESREEKVEGSQSARKEG